ncbi:mitochondrial ATP synthase g subunit-domain-containing protein [Fomitopsis serialis]|uniref:mitochondrial ATP synthase g subunit-domain-containing protein n=1 Tax=Fomitopsis serialis TaxID=139415 RepID=UPI002007A323|nr:mitochondrial ATP synthase g subunit-domain-containing protein [Neoantrodia serialis]KAH9925497.1 mitochondrial ATP synthase g subunit-domain-containing protein [Neoantrodia serialis]
MRASVPFRLAQLRPRVHVQKRFASSTPGGGFNVNTAEAQKKAEEAVAAAGKRLGQAVEVGKKYMGPVGEKAGSMLGSYREPLLYNLSVAREFLKQVYVAERLQPPTSLPVFQHAYSTLWSRASNPAYWRELVRSGDWTKVGVYALEAYGIFKIGEIIGRRSLVGYKVE